ncbi:E3 ubiquitin-protein ligase RNF25 isoform X2 [Bicyclus anynana]|uniref:E3 ubiquitin-protein ligase RNF25 isoform X2 n=1 Tax=Bicyclus anynana TaxID=110368 RepID=A0A6J1MZQ7_BICAN|nr:E3 ubiquitin-protein ligase RNF25 isoform X2 [Bicyclus anynana]
MHLENLSRPSPDLILASLPSAVIMSTAVDVRINDELQALQAILINGVAVKDEDGVPRVIETVVHPSTGDKVEQQYVCVTLEVILTPDYPESSPEVILRNPRGLDEAVVSNIHSKIKEKLDCHIGNPILFELIEIVREYLTQCNLPSGQCVICLHNFVNGDEFIKTPCYHHFHSHCLSKHLINSRKYYDEEMEKLPNWQRVEATPYKQTCPVCRCEISFDVKTLEQAPPPVDSVNAPPFMLTDDLKALQERMAAQLARQIARGGVVGSGDDGPPLLTITTAADKEEVKPSTSAVQAAKPEPRPSTSAEATPEVERQQCRVPFRGFNRRAKPGRRERGAPR